MNNNPVRFNDPSGHRSCDSEDVRECEYSVEHKSVFDNWEKILLAATIYSETSNGTYPKGLAMIGWVYLNRVTSGAFSTLVKAVGPGQSALISGLKADFPWLSNLLNLSPIDIKRNLTKMNSSMMNGANKAGWENAINAAKNVLSQYESLGKKADPTGGATDFRAVGIDQFETYVRAYEHRKSNPTDFPQFDYSFIGPFYGGPVLGRDIYLFFNNISYVSILNPNLVNQ